MRTSARYINRQLLSAFAVTLAVLVAIALGDRLIRFFEKASIGGIPGDMVLFLVMLRMPELLQIIIPVAFYTAILLAFGRLYSSQEMVILQSGGMTTRRLLLWLSLPTLAITMIVAITSLVITPKANLALEESAREFQQRAGLAALSPGNFHYQRRNETVTYSESLSEDGQSIVNVFVERKLGKGEHSVIWAERGSKGEMDRLGRQPLSLYNGKRYVGTPGTNNYEVMNFAEFHLLLQTEAIIDQVYDIQAIPTLQLDASAEHQAELHWRIALPIFLFVVSLLALSKSSVKPRQGQYARLAPGILWILGYYAALIINRWALAEGLVPTSFGMWLVHTGFAAIALHGISRMDKPAKQ